LFFALVGFALAQDPPYADYDAFKASAGYPIFTVHNLWMMIAAALVFIMNLGFAAVESGLTRSKNTANILFKNAIIPCIGLLTYAIVGFSTMYPGEFNGWLKLGGPIGFPEADAVGKTTDAYNPSYTYWTDFLFQAMFAATAATIVSGAVAERIKLGSFLVFSTIFVALVYPIAGAWKWGYGWLYWKEGESYVIQGMGLPGFIDFAGSTVVHSVGGWGALAGVILLGARLGKYRDGKVIPIFGHSMPLATIGVFLLWLGWFGFNGGSVLSADPALVSLVLVTTSLAGATGGFVATIVSWILAKKPDVSMALNGILAGLVAITAGADAMGVFDAILIGGIGGALAVFAVGFFDKLKLDDPVGALSVHLVNGIWGTLAVGIFGKNAGGQQLIAQLVGVAAIGAFSFVSAFLIFLVIKATIGLRVSAEEEREGLDLGEHGHMAYPDFVQSHT
jgi:Amt family ammonium transporter